MMKYKYLPQLDSLKLCAMFLVFTTHCYMMNLTGESEIIYDKYFVFSGVGVEFFIMVSGFFAAYTFVDGGVRDYIQKKCYRLFPVHWFCLIVAGYLLGTRCEKIPILTPLSATLLQSLIPISGDTNPPCWTLSTLFILYLATPFLVKKLKKIPHNFYLVLIIVLSVLSTIINYFWYDPSHKYMFWLLYVSPYYRVLTYSIGLLVGLMIKVGDLKFLSIIKRNCTLFEIASISCVLILICVFHKAPGYWYTVFIALMITVFAVGGGALTKLLSNKILLKVSKLSFCFYLIHFPILQTMEYYVCRCVGLTSNMVYLAVLSAFLLSLVSAVVLNKYIEKPLSRIRIITYKSK